MIKKEYIQPEAKEIEVKLTTILAGSIKNTDTGYTFGGDDEFSDDDPISADEGL